MELKINFLGLKFSLGQKASDLPDPFKGDVPPSVTSAEAARLARLPKERADQARKRLKQITEARDESDKRIPDTYYP